MIDLSAKRFGDWTVISFSHKTPRPNNDTFWNCSCICGTARAVSGRNLRNGGSLGCGCTKKGLRLRPFEALYNYFIAQATMRSVAVDITYEEFLTFTSEPTCVYCGTPVVWKPHNIAGKPAYNLDRKNNRLGYTKENCVVCCWPCNQTKSARFTHFQMKQIGEVIRRLRKKGAQIR